MLYKWKEGSMSRNGKIILKAGDFIPEGLLDDVTIERFIKKGSIDVIKEPQLPKGFKKQKKNVVKSDAPSVAGVKVEDPDIENLM